MNMHRNIVFADCCHALRRATDNSLIVPPFRSFDYGQLRVGFLPGKKVGRYEGQHTLILFLPTVVTKHSLSRTTEYSLIVPSVNSYAYGEA